MRAGSEQVREVACGETLTVDSTNISVDSETATVTGNIVVFSEPGRYTVTCEAGSFAVLAFEPEALDMVPAQQSAGAIGRERSEHERRMVLRSLATHGSDWDGTAADVRRHHLQRHGA
jgi:hypothetical protein